MKSKKTTTVTLQSIGKLIDRKFDQRLFPIDKELKNLNTKIVGIYSEIDGVKQQIVGLDHKIDTVGSKLETHRQETKAGFDTVFEGLESLGSTVDLEHEKRIKHLETKIFAN